MRILITDKNHGTCLINLDHVVAVQIQQTHTGWEIGIITTAIEGSADGPYSKKFWVVGEEALRLKAFFEDAADRNFVRVPKQETPS